MVAYALMVADDVTFSSTKFLHLIGRYGLVGAWSWHLTGQEHIWSPGFFGLLGMTSRQIAPRYDRFVDLVHPEDRDRLPTAASILEGIVPRQAVVRVLGADRKERVLSVLMEMRFAPDGRPCGVSGIALDVSDPASLKQYRRIDHMQSWGRYADTHTTPYWLGLEDLYKFPDDMAEVHGLPAEVVRETPHVMIIPEERVAVHARYLEQIDRCLFFQGTVQERLATGEIRRFRLLTAPVWDAEGAFLGRTGLKYPVDCTVPAPATGALLIGLTQAVEGHHIRAARALLDWSRTTLAAASGLSYSTVRRLEEDGISQSDQARYRIVGTLREAGIRFTTTDEGTVAISRV